MNKNRLVPALAVAILAVAPSVASAACPDTGIYPTTANAERVERLVLCLTNEARAAAGVTPVTLDARLQKTARAFAVDKVVRGFKGHVDPDGDDIPERIAADGYPGGAAVGENWAGALETYSVKDTFALWMGSATHRKNILSASFRHIGVGAYLRKSGEQGSIVQDFGGASGAAQAPVPLTVKITSLGGKLFVSGHLEGATIGTHASIALQPTRVGRSAQAAVEPDNGRFAATLTKPLSGSVTVTVTALVDGKTVTVTKTA
ncbi:sporulation protein [Paraconexibacter sp. AEG42_29]|uniref:Sporulation protein n=1 Tax=Paraconexibacter sp. AEG42_29 TaxID=2997339 RepID=A0AAU7B3J3_9ACTN